jgi:hypothetical protein
MELPPDTQLTIISVVASSFGAVGSLGWWLSGRFRSVEKATAETIARHELIDQERHEENLGRFEKINVTLASMSRQRHG